MADSDFVLEAYHISKTFPGVQALSDFDFQLVHGEIHGLLGENGAGKTTFIKLLNGLFQPDRGEILIQGRRIERLSPVVSNQLGIKFVHQELSVLPWMSIIDNIYANAYPRSRLGTIDWRRAFAETRTLLKEYSLDLDPRSRLCDLSIGQMQLIEILANLSKNAHTIVMDEPTASLGDTEKARLFHLMRALRERGISIIFISHILEEALSICDEITVLRDGRKVGTWENSGLAKEFLIEKIVGEKVEERAVFAGGDLEGGTITRPALQVEKVHYGNILKGVSFTLEYGRILGILGLLGAGKSELANICFGLARPSQGSIAIDGKPVSRLSPPNAIRWGMGYVTEDRHKSGIFHFLSIAKNCSIIILKLLTAFLLVIDRKQERRVVSKTTGELDIKMSSLEQEIRHLSGGNQQKALLARWLIGNQKLLIFDEPTKGVDVGARSEFYNIVLGLKRQGRAVLILTSDHREALQICERILLLKNGKLVEYEVSRGASPRDLLNALTAVEN